MNAASQFACISLNSEEITGTTPSDHTEVDGTIQASDPQSTVACSAADLDMVENWIHDELPGFNEHTEAGVMTADEFLDEATKRMRTVQSAVGSATRIISDLKWQTRLTRLRRHA